MTLEQALTPVSTGYITVLEADWPVHDYTVDSVNSTNQNKPRAPALPATTLLS